MRKVFHHWQCQSGKINHEIYSLPVQKVFQVGHFQLDKINHEVGIVQFLKVLHLECFKLGKINSRVDRIQVQKVFITKTFHQGHHKESTTNFTSCIITSASTTRKYYGVNYGNLWFQIHGVALGNRIREDIDARNLISPSMIRRRGFYHWFRDILSAAEFSSNFPEHHPRTHIAYRILRTFWPDRYTHLIRINDQNRRVILITQRQFCSIDLIAPNSENADDLQDENLQRIIENYNWVIWGDYNSRQYPNQFNQQKIDDDFQQEEADGSKMEQILLLDHIRYKISYPKDPYLQIPTRTQDYHRVVVDGNIG